MCGEHIHWCHTCCVCDGSSPRVRGTLADQAAELVISRFIPACAGNTVRNEFRRCNSTVHPRVCGEHGEGDYQPYKITGSSPRVRGTLCFDRDSITMRRFIPACAGNTTQLRLCSISVSVHPRVCGEHPAGLKAYSAVFGSSPRVRGTRPIAPSVDSRNRFIPACAGNTLLSCPTPADGTVHPRVCGEHPELSFQSLEFGGSSPRVRGTRCRGFFLPRRIRFIPACAGNTSPPCRAARIRTVHPRVCGEHGFHRGTAVLRLRFIPACAGNTTVNPVTVAVTPVHPRVCGEHQSIAISSTHQNGSSPRVRGTRRPSYTDVEHGRFIPACAGNTKVCKGAAQAYAVHPRVCGEHAA